MIVVLASLTLLSVQPRHASKESKPKQELELEFEISIKPTSLTTITHTKWRLDAWEFEYLPFLAFAWRRSEELESYDVL